MQPKLLLSDNESILKNKKTPKALIFQGLQRFQCSLIPHNDVEKIILALTAIANRSPITNDETFKIGSWRTVQAINRLGLASQFFHVGTQFQFEHGTYGTGTQHLLTADVLGIDFDVATDENGTQLTTLDASGNVIPAHTMTIQLHDCIGTKYMYNQRAHTETGTSTNNWRDSDIRAWLNTDEIITGYSANKGFLDNFDPDLLAVVGYCAKSTLRNSASGGDGGKAVRTIERFFLPSRTEVFARTESTITDNTIPESTIIKSEDTTVNTDKKYYVSDTSNVLTVAVPTGTENPKTLGWYEIKAEYDFYGAERSDYENPSEGNDVNRKKRIGTGNYDYWWLRSPVTFNANSARYVNYDGYINNIHVTNTIGVAPACCII